MESVRMNVLDRLIGWLSPSAGLRRARSRAASEVLAAYEGARIGRRTEGWITAGTDANAAIGNDLIKLRDRSRDLIRNNALAHHMKSVIVSGTVGTQILPQADTGDDRLNQQINEAYARWCEECDAEGELDFYGMQRQWAEAIFESGEVLVRRRSRRPQDGLHVPLQLQTLEADHLDLSAYRNSSGGATIHGVEFDAIGRRAGYWMYPVHPGASLSVGMKPNYSSKFVPASEIAHAYRKERPGQVRGVPWLAPVMLLLRDMDEYNEAEIVRAKVAACLSVFVEQPLDAPDGTVGKATTEDATGNRLERIRPGMIIYGKPGEKPSAIVPTGHSNFAEYMKFEQHLAAVGVDMFYAQASGDLAAVNWSSFRAGDRDYRAAIEAFRWLCLIPMACVPVWRWFIDSAYLAGRIPEQNYGVTWTPPQFQSVNPLADAQSDEAEMANGSLSWPEMVARRGLDPTKLYQQIREWQQRFDKDGVVFAWDRRKVNASGTIQAKQAGTQQE